MSTSGCAIIYFCLMKKNNDLLSPSDPFDREVFWKKYSIRISLQSTTKLLPICSFVKKKTRLPEKLYVSTGVSLS